MILPGRATGSAYLMPASGRRAAAGAPLASLASGAEIAIVARQHDGEIVGEARVDRLQVDDLRALDHAEAQPGFRFESDNLHGVFPLILPARTRGITGALVDYFAGPGKRRGLTSNCDLVLRSLRSMASRRTATEPQRVGPSFETPASHGSSG